MIDERDAVEATQRFLAASHQALLDEASLTIGRELIDERDAWVIGEVRSPKRDGAEDADPVHYLVDVITGRVFGYFTTGRLFGKQVRLSRSIFPDEAQVPGQFDLSTTPDERERETRKREALAAVVNRYLERIGTT